MAHRRSVSFSSFSKKPRRLCVWLTATQSQQLHEWKESVCKNRLNEETCYVIVIIIINILLSWSTSTSKTSSYPNQRVFQPSDCLRVRWCKNDEYSPAKWSRESCGSQKALVSPPPDVESGRFLTLVPWFKHPFFEWLFQLDDASQIFTLKKWWFHHFHPLNYIIVV